MDYLAPSSFRGVPPPDGPTLDCDGANFKRFMILEFGVKSLPALLMLVCGTIRYCSICHIGTASSRVSRIFIAKFVLSFFMSVMTLAYIALVIAMKST